MRLSNFLRGSKRLFTTQITPQVMKLKILESLKNKDISLSSKIVKDFEDYMKKNNHINDLENFYQTLITYDLNPIDKVKGLITLSVNLLLENKDQQVKDLIKQSDEYIENLEGIDVEYYKELIRAIKSWKDPNNNMLETLKNLVIKLDENHFIFEKVKLLLTELIQTMGYMLIFNPLKIDYSNKKLIGMNLISVLESLGQKKEHFQIDHSYLALSMIQLSEKDYDGVEDVLLNAKKYSLSRHNHQLYLLTLLKLTYYYCEVLDEENLQKYMDILSKMKLTGDNKLGYDFIQAKYYQYNRDYSRYQRQGK